MQIWAMAVLGEPGGLRQDILDAFVDAIEQVLSLEARADGSSGACLHRHEPACTCMISVQLSAASSSLGLTDMNVPVLTSLWA